MKIRQNSIKYWISIILTLAANSVYAEMTDPLPSWNEGPTKQALIHFVTAASTQGNKNYIPSDERIATIDNDGTLWVEQPLYTQAEFALDRIKAMASQHPEWKNTPPFSAVLSNDEKQMAKLNVRDFMHLVAASHTGLSVEQFNKIAQDWLATAQDPRFKRLHTELVYQPMLEVMTYLRDHGFKVYIVSGGGQDFMRAYSQKTYGVPPEQVIGTSFKTQYTLQAGKPVLLKLPAILEISDGPGKPEAINFFIGRRPVIAFGNSDGDRQMLEWTEANTQPHLMLLVHHDDGKREYAYGPLSKVGTFSDSLMTEANSHHWQVISMKNDWKVIFPAGNN